VADHLSEVLAVVEQPFSFTELAHDLLGGVAVSLHGLCSPPAQMLGAGLSQLVDRYPGVPSEVPELPWSPTLSHQGGIIGGMTWLRWLGLILQLIGYGALVLQGYRDRLAYTDHPGIVATVKETTGRWWRRLGHKPQTLQVSAAGHAHSAGHVTLTQTFAPVDTPATIERRLDEVERQLRHLEQRHNQLSLGFSDEVSRREQVANAEKEAREQLDASLRQAVRNLASAGLRLEAWSVALVAAGTVLTTIG
jgi:hypothetical protein